MRISDWSSDVCSSDLQIARQPSATALGQDVHWNSAARGSRGTRMSQESIPPAVDYSRVFSQAIDRLHTEGRYRVRSEERRVGKACVSTCRHPWSQYQ